MAERFVDSKIKPGKVTVFIKRECPYCVRALEILQQYRFKPEGFEVLSVNDQNDTEKIMQCLLEKTGQRTVPRIFFGNNCIGGCSELSILESNGKLDQTLQTLGALQ
ncbi:glutaredoxin-1-like [Pelobates fuscus]|uniref:glutaredoxin-1-like n=1 Tax=Pelobates fuscus TaxID=191477 RepID=UPI002FE4D364